MAPKEAYWVGLILDRASMALLLVSLVYVAWSVQVVRMSLNRKRPGVFPLTWLVCAAFLFEAYARSGVLVAEDSVGAAQVFKAFDPLVKAKQDLELPQVLLFVLRTLALEENNSSFVTRVLLFGFSVFLALNRAYYGSGADSKDVKPSKIGIFLCTISLASILGYIGLSCGGYFLNNPLRRSFIKETHHSLVEISQGLQTCMPGTYGFGGALVTIFLTHASLYWTKGGWVGWQHVLAFRWLGAIAGLLRLYVTKRLVFGPELGTSTRDQCEAFSLIVQIVLVSLVFIPKFAYRQPVSFFLILGILGGLVGLSSGHIPVSAEIGNRVTEGFGLVSVATAVTAIFFSGGVGMAFSLLIVYSSMLLHAPWMKRR